MASFAPSVFAQSEDQEANNDEATSSVAENTENTDSSEAEVPASETLKVTFTPSASKAAAGDEVSFDVALTSPVVIESLQFNFDVVGAEIVKFDKNEANCAAIGFAGSNLSYDADANVVLGYNLDFAGDPANNTVIGTLTVKVAADANDGDVVTAKVSDATADYNYGDSHFVFDVADGTVTVGAAESEASSEATSEASSVADSATSSTTSTTDSSSKATTNNSSKAGTNGTTSNTNTGAASTAAVALAASAAALVVISKKRK